MNKSEYEKLLEEIHDIRTTLFSYMEDLNNEVKSKLAEIEYDLIRFSEDNGLEFKDTKNEKCFFYIISEFSEDSWLCDHFGVAKDIDARKEQIEKLFEDFLICEVAFQIECTSHEVAMKIKEYVRGKYSDEDDEIKSEFSMDDWERMKEDIRKYYECITQS